MKRLGLTFAAVALVACSAPAVASATPWRIVPIPVPAGTVLSALNAVSCSGAEACTAVGYYGTTHNTGVDRTLAERWNGSRWEIQPTPTPAGGGLLSGVSCVSRVLCVAVGQGERGIFSEIWNGMAWRVVAMPSPAGGRSSLESVSCSSSSACMAVGMQINDAGEQAPIAERWNGVTWQIETPVTPPQGGALSGVSCTSASACAAVGSVPLGGVSGTLAERWNGSKWEVQPTPTQTIGSWMASRVSRSSSARPLVEVSASVVAWIPSPSIGTA